MPTIAIVSLLTVFLAVPFTSVRPLPLESEGVPVVAAVAPLYPHIAATARVSGNTRVEVSIDPSGRVVDARLLAGHKLLGPISEITARRWRFASGDTVAKRTAQVTFTFVLLPVDSTSDDAGVTFFPPSRVEVRYLPRELEVK